MSRACWIAWALAALAPAVRSQEEDHHGLLDRLGADDREAWFRQPFITGEWWGLRSRLEELGMSFDVSLITDTSWPLTGGVRERRTDRALFDVALEVDLERVAGLSNATAFAEFYSESGRNASDDVGDIQGFSNIDADNVAQLAELWLERTTPDGQLRFKLGKLDANSEFAHVDAGFGFINSSAGYSPTIFVFPTYPDPAVSFNLFARPADQWQIGLGVYNAEDGGAVSGRRGLTADFDEAFLIGQVDRTWDGLGRLADGHLALGLWHHTGDLDRFDGGTESGSEGAYAILEQRLTREHSEDPGDAQGLTGFLQWGIADGDVSEFEGHFGAGLLYEGLLPGRDSWHTGLYLTHVNLTDEDAAGLGAEELAIELFQEIALTPSILVKPDLQYIVDPSGRDDIDDAWVFTVRLKLLF